MQAGPLGGSAGLAQPRRRGSRSVSGRKGRFAMKWIAGASALLLTGLCGCISVKPAGPEDVHAAGAVRRASESAAVRPATPPAAVVADNQAPSSTSRWTGASVPQPAPVAHTAARPTTRPLAGVPQGVAPGPLPSLLQAAESPTAPRPPAHAPAPAPVVVHPDMPSASTPRSELTQPTVFVSPEPREPTVLGAPN